VTAGASPFTFLLSFFKLNLISLCPDLVFDDWAEHLLECLTRLMSVLCEKSSWIMAFGPSIFIRGLGESTSRLCFCVS
jgi:hypothetical protein